MKKENFFWVSYSDLMTSLFFIMLVLFVVTVGYLQFEKSVLIEEKEILETVQKNVEKLQDRNDLFNYDEQYKRFTLKFDVQFKTNRYEITEKDLMNFDETKKKLEDTGLELKRIIDNLEELQRTNEAYKNISYMIVVAGSASRLGDEDYNYELSYKRAYNLYKFWRDDLGIDFDKKQYHQLLEFQIAGNGTGGIGRVEPLMDKKYTYKNQRFIINVVPKVGGVIEKNKL